MARIIGNEGSATMGTHNIVINAWSLNVSRPAIDTTSYGDRGGRSVGGMPTYTGSVSGFLKYNAASTSPALAYTNFATGTSVSIVMFAKDSTCKWTAGTSVVSNVSLSSSKTGDMTVSFDFTASGGVVEAWGS